jgi:hypothetical protein
MKKTICTIIIIILLFIGGAIDHLIFKTPTKGNVIIQKPTVSDTTYDSNLNQAITLNDCDKIKAIALSKINISGKMNDDGKKLEIEAWDAGKSAHADFPISCNSITRHNIIQVNYMVQYHDSSIFTTYGVSYLYNFGRVAIGGGVLGSDKCLGIQGIAQINF